jgi:hypothetical protein|tara:strand:- start:2504 stop:2644 length:141 start_codon:yes stop_codon:yes gene_type:complete
MKSQIFFIFISRAPSAYSKNNNNNNNNNQKKKTKKKQNVALLWCGA